MKTILQRVKKWKAVVQPAKTSSKRFAKVTKN